jgi:Na+/melibiose symporter-like transporter
LVAAVVVLAVAAVTVVPEDSLASWVFTFSGVALVVGAGFVLFAAIFRRSERAFSVYAATLVLVGVVLFLVLHSLFISD